MALDPRIYSYVKTEESYPDKGVIVKEGAHGDWIYVVLEGRVKVRKKTEKGMLTVATLKEGAVFGELVFLQNKRGQRSASVVADGAVTVGIFDPNQLGSELGKLSPMLRKLLASLADRLEEVSGKLVTRASQ
ncbi:MAG: cyclic nucleotide-binding domain-containing protein [Pseudomonadota bacterium]